MGSGHGLAAIGALVIAVLAIGALHVARASDSEPLLPDLVADPPDNAMLETSSIGGRARLLLRFNGYIHNIGPGALDFRGSRAKPTVKGMSESQLQEEVQLYRSRENVLPQSLEEELAVPAMNLFQRVYSTNEGNPAKSEKYLERPHVEEPSTGEIFYSNADGHHHWHLQHVAEYSLWNASRTAEVAPAQKVGFCLEDSQHVEADKGPSTPVYADNVPPYRRFCRRFEPDTTSVYEGVSPGWRDVYGRELAFQWVDASDVTPGEYWLREAVDPTGVIKQATDANKTAYALTPTIIPGFDAAAQTLSVEEGEATTVSLFSHGYQDDATPLYTVASQPQHGTLSTVEGNQVTYTPEAGYSGTDSFTFSARDPSSPFPEDAEVATVSIAVQSTQPSVSISGAQAEMTAGTSVQLAAEVTNNAGAVEWEASAGTIAPEGAGDRKGLYTAPSRSSELETVTVTARLQDNRTISDERTIAIKPVAPVEPAPEVPTEPGTGTASESTETQTSGSGTTTTGTSGSNPAHEPDTSTTDGSATGSSGGSTGGPTSGPGTNSTDGLKSGSTLTSPTNERLKPKSTAPSISRPGAMLFDRTLVMTTLPSVAGRVRLAAYLDRHLLGTCVTQTPARRVFTCRIALGAKVSLRSRINVLASLRVGHLLLHVPLPAQRIPTMSMTPVGLNGGTRASLFRCSPSTLTGVLVGQR